VRQWLWVVLPGEGTHSAWPFGQYEKGVGVGLGHDAAFKVAAKVAVKVVTNAPVTAQDTATFSRLL
jgi:hypothetical protein